MLKINFWGTVSKSHFRGTSYLINQSLWALVFCIHKVEIIGLVYKSKECRGIQFFYSKPLYICKLLLLLLQVIVMISNDYSWGPACGFVKPVGLFSAVSGCFFSCDHCTCKETPSKQCLSISNCIWVSWGLCWNANFNKFEFVRIC